MKCLCEVLPQLLGGTINSETVFPWRCFLMDANVSKSDHTNQPNGEFRDLIDIAQLSIRANIDGYLVC